MTNALLWQVTSPAGMNSFLLGTMHVRDIQAFGSIDQIKGYIDQSDLYFSELEMESDSMEVLAEFHQMPDGQSLRDLMSDHHYDRLRKSILRSFKMDIHSLGHLYPMIVANIIQTSLLTNASDVILDFYLFRYARDQGKTMCFLESQKEQLAFFHQIPLDYQVKSLLQLGRQPAKAKKQMLALLKDYSSKNTRQLYQRSKKQLGKMRHVLLYQRNEKMAERLIHQLHDRSGFVSVGAAHLFGYKGVLRLMKKGGYKIKAQSRKQES